MSAIAAVLALSSTALIAQAAPEVTQPVTEAPATPVTESAPAAPTASEPSAATVSDPIAPSAEPATTAKSTKSTTTHRTASVARPAKAAPPVARAAVAAPVAAPVAETATAAPVPLVAEPAAPPPAVAAPPPVQETPAASNNMLAIAGAIGLALLALIGLAVALRRRKLRREEEFAAAEQVEPVYEGPVAGRSAVRRALSAPSRQRPLRPRPSPNLRRRKGPVPTPRRAATSRPRARGRPRTIPSLSIKKRLKRAQFFDQREMLVAAGEAVPVAADAGLPDAVEAPEARRSRAPASGCDPGATRLIADAE